MAFADKTIMCSDCGAPFTFTAGEQEFYQKRGFKNTPKRCVNCRDNRKPRGGGRGRSSHKEKTYTATCAKCGVEAQVPFPPSPDKPLYCSACYDNR